MKNKKHINLTAYDEVEQLSSFDHNSFAAYCEMKLAETTKHIQFLRKILPRDKRIDLCEIGSGNSKLLYRLEKEAMINSATGFEISSSRYAFAEKFKSYCNSNRVTNINKNIFDVKPSKKYGEFNCEVQQLVKFSF